MEEDRDLFERASGTWHKSFSIVTKLSNGKWTWFRDNYEQRFMGDVIEVIDEEEYIMRKLAGTLNPEYVPPKRSGSGKSRGFTGA